ncbi:MAG: hypothetical protein K2Y23_06930 [Cyanobacteria bacterium]|nr:hypothetical protein [Cyanobacteriota bacterium]
MPNMSSDAEFALVYATANTPIRSFPYPHIYTPDVFPPAFYADLQHNMPDPEAMIPLEQARGIKGYNERFVLDLRHHVNRLPGAERAFWAEFAGWLLSGRVMKLMLDKFGQFVAQRFNGTPEVRFHDEALLVKDITRYSIGPHTDSPRKVLTFLFYLPMDESQSHLGTSIYVPHDATFKCSGRAHHGFENFHRVATMPFRPNSLFGFVKGDESFHGVEPVNDLDCKRWLLLYDIYQEPAKPRDLAAV